MLKIILVLVAFLVACGGPAEPGTKDAGEEPDAPQIQHWNCGDNGWKGEVADASPGPNCFPSGYPNGWCCVP